MDQSCPILQQVIIQKVPDLVVHTWNLSSQMAEAGGSPWVQDQFEKHSKFHASLDDEVKFCLLYIKPKM